MFPVAEQVRGAGSTYQGAAQKQGKAMMSKRSIVFDMVLSLGGEQFSSLVFLKIFSLPFPDFARHGVTLALEAEAGWLL